MTKRTWKTRRLLFAESELTVEPSPKDMDPARLALTLHRSGDNTERVPITTVYFDHALFPKCTHELWH